MTVSDLPAANPALPSDPPAPEPQRRVGALFLVAFGFANFGLYLVVLMPALFSLPYKVGVLAPDEKVAVLGLVATIGAVVGLVTGPVAGVLSDRTRTPIGRRRPWFFGGILVLALGSTLVALAPTVPMLILGWVVVSIGGSCITAAIAPIVADHRLRARDEDVVYAPSYRRGLEEPIAASIAVPRDVPLVLTEGNYLLTDHPDLRAAREDLDEVWFLDTPHDIRIRQLVARHVAFGKSEPDAQAWASGTDQRNAEQIEATRQAADLIVAIEA